MHRRTRIEDTAGAKESLIHALMMAEGIAAAIGTCVLLPSGEELLRCRRAARAREQQARDEATW